ncbi:MAG TPA: hypothetical protein VKX17_03080 [Planctomycetota bacterium]|nr:hypothetical protein [Planctomycetota bacterium]
MNKTLIATLAATLALAPTLRADDPNPEVAKAIQEIAARRAEKEQARIKQTEAWARSEGQERAWSGTVGATPPGAAVNPKAK